jgi:CheY-like chemotaxis protein
LKYTNNHYNWEGKTILIVEDDVPNFKYFDILLKETNARILWSKNGKDAVNICCSSGEKIDLVIMDIIIPFLSGIEATRKIKKHKKDIPVIAVSAYATSDNRKGCFIAGCDEFLFKPVLPKMLLETLSPFLDTENKHSKELNQVYKK